MFKHFKNYLRLSSPLKITVSLILDLPLTRCCSIRFIQTVFFFDFLKIVLFGNTMFPKQRQHLKDPDCLGTITIITLPPLEVYFLFMATASLLLKKMRPSISFPRFPFKKIQYKQNLKGCASTIRFHSTLKICLRKIL